MRTATALLIAGCTWTAIGALAQGQVNFNNKVGTTVDAPVYDGLTKVSGADWLAQLYVGKDEGSLAPVGATAVFRTGAGAGYFIGGARDISIAGTVLAQVRVWEAAGGASYEAAAAAGKKYGKSNAVSVTPMIAPNPPADLVGLQPQTSVKGLFGPGEKRRFRSRE